MQKDLKKDKCIGNWFSTMKTSTATAYRNGVIKFCEYTKKTPAQLIDEAKKDYIDRVPPWELKHLAQLEQFTNMLKGLDAANNSKLTWVRGVKNFYAFHKLPIIGFKLTIPQSSRESYLDLPVLKIEDIRKAILDCGTNKKLKAMILTFLSSGQGQAEVRKLQGRHLKNIVNGVAVVAMTRGKTNRRCTFFIGSEALNAIKEYKPNLKDEEFIFCRKDGGEYRPQEIDGLIYRHCEKIGLDRSYFAPHRFRHYFKSTKIG